MALHPDYIISNCFPQLYPDIPLKRAAHLFSLEERGEGGVEWKEHILKEQIFYRERQVWFLWIRKNMSVIRIPPGFADIVPSKEEEFWQGKTEPGRNNEDGTFQGNYRWRQMEGVTFFLGTLDWGWSTNQGLGVIARARNDGCGFCWRILKLHLCHLFSMFSVHCFTIGSLRFKPNLSDIGLITISHSKMAYDPVNY